MMGFPALGPSEDEDSEPESDPIKQTLFGFPAQKSGQADDDGGPDDAPEDEHDVAAADDEDEQEEYAQTHIIPASDFDFPDQIDNDDELRGTIAGMPLKGSDGEPEYGDDDDRTEIVSGTAVFPGIPRPDDSDPESDDPRAHGGTLMGMSLEDIHQAGDDENAHRATQFAIPAVQGDEEKSSRGDEAATISDQEIALDEESEEPLDDAPTQAWSPGSLDLKGKFDPDGRKKLLEKIRKSKPAQRDTSKGLPTASAEGKQKGPKSGMAPSDGPDLSALRKLRPKRELKPTPVEFPENESEVEERPRPPTAPGSGVLRPAPPRTDQDKRQEKSDSTQVPGSYILGREDTDTEETKGVPIGSISPVPAKTAGQSELGDSLSDPDFGLGETDIASGDLLEKAGFAKTLSFGAGVATNRPATQDTGPDRFDQSQPAQQGQQGQQGQQQAPPVTNNQPERFSDRANTPPPQFQETGERTAGPGVYDTFDGPRTPHGRQTTAPSGERPRPQHSSQPQPAPQQATTRNDNSRTINQPGEPAEDPLVRRIQSLFGILAGIIALVVQAVVLLDGSPTTAGIVIVALAVTLGIAAILAAAAPLPTQIRSFALFGIAGLLFAAIVLGLIVSLPTTFLVVGLAAIVALMAGGFPYFARHLL